MFMGVSGVGVVIWGRNRPDVIDVTKIDLPEEGIVVKKK